MLYIEEESNLEEFFYYQDNSPVHHLRIARQLFDDQLFPCQLIRTPTKFLT